MNPVDEIIQEGLSEVDALGLPPWAEFLLAVAVVLAAAFVVDLVLDGLLRGLARRTRIAFDDAVIGIVHRPVVIAVVLYGLDRSLELLPLEPDRLLLIQRLLLTVLSAVVALAAARILHLIIDNYLSQISNVSGLDEEMGPFLKIVVNIGVVTAWLVWVLVIWDQSIAPIIASAGVAGLAVSLAARDALANIFGAISIFLERTYQIGDYLELVDVPGIGRGEVTSIGLRSTRLKTRDDVVVTVPNSIMANSAIVNQSAVQRFRVRIAVGTAYGSDTDLVEETLLRIADANPLVLAEPAPRLRLRSLGDTALLFELLCWCGDPAERGRLMHELNATIHVEFAQLGIEIPVPQLDVRMRAPGPQGPTASDHA